VEKEIKEEKERTKLDIKRDEALAELRRKKVEKILKMQEEKARLYAEHKARLQAVEMEALERAANPQGSNPPPPRLARAQHLLATAKSMYNQPKFSEEMSRAKPKISSLPRFSVKGVATFGSPAQVRGLGRGPPTLPRVRGIPRPPPPTGTSVGVDLSLGFRPRPPRIQPPPSGNPQVEQVPRPRRRAVPRYW
jgi:hypothetical protein